MMRLEFVVEIKDFCLGGLGFDQLPKGCWLLRNARVFGADYGDADCDA